MVEDLSKTTLHQGTLLDLLDPDKDKRGGLNVLDLPMGGAPVPTPPHYEFVKLLYGNPIEITDLVLDTLPPMNRLGRRHGI
jgi:hypothetical protein